MATDQSLRQYPYCKEDIRADINKRKNCGSSVTLSSAGVFVWCALAITLLTLQSCGGPWIVLKPKNPTHKFVCQCNCKSALEGSKQEETQTYEIPISGNCGELDKKLCALPRDDVGRLRECVTKGVPNLERVLKAQEAVEAKRVE